MSKILMVDDDPVTLQAYKNALTLAGYQVSTARDGLEAMRVAQNQQPDLVVLDLMMPQFDGYDVLKFIRSQDKLRKTRVVVLSSLTLGDAESHAATGEADASLLKLKCTPALLIETLENVLAGKAVNGAGKVANGAGHPEAADETDKSEQKNIANEFLQNAPALLATLRQVNDAFVHAEDEQLRRQRLLDFFHRVRALGSQAALAGYSQIALLASAFSGMLLELHERPVYINRARIQTIIHTLDFLGLLLADARYGKAVAPISPKVMVVEDDAVAHRIIVSTLERANLRADGFQDPIGALSVLESERYGLILLDVEMPGMDGFQFCARARAMPQYAKTPILFVTAHCEFDNRIRGIESGGNDVLAKPIFPSELAVKALTHLLRTQLPEPWAFA